MLMSRRELNFPSKIFLVYRQCDLPKAYALTADSFVSYALTPVAIKLYIYLKVRVMR